MSRNCFQMILKFICFADNTFYDPKDPNRDRLYEVRPIVEFVVNKFKSAYVPSKFISIAEELLLWKGRLIFKQYIPNKRSWFGMKMFSLCEDSGYLWNLFVYFGKNGKPEPEEKQLENRIGKNCLETVKIFMLIIGTLVNHCLSVYMNMILLPPALLENKKQNQLTKII